MIRLSKITEPDILVKNKDNWTSAYVDARAKSEDTSKMNYYRHPDIKTQLIIESSNKCIYCESKLLHISFGDVEHIWPKSRFPQLTFTWSNLGLVCTKCNNNKTNYFDHIEQLINPYIHKVNDHIYPFGSLIWHVSNDVIGEITIKKIGLNREQLIERRHEKIESLSSLRDRYVATDNPALKDILREEILIEIAPDKEYSMILKSFIEGSSDIRL